jgi:hypothetical protein
MRGVLPAETVKAVRKVRIVLKRDRRVIAPKGLMLFYRFQ